MNNRAPSICLFGCVLIVTLYCFFTLNRETQLQNGFVETVTAKEEQLEALLMDTNLLSIQVSNRDSQIKSLEAKQRTTEQMVDFLTQQYYQVAVNKYPPAILHDEYIINGVEVENILPLAIIEEEEREEAKINNNNNNQKPSRGSGAPKQGKVNITLSIFKQKEILLEKTFIRFFTLNQMLKLKTKYAYFYFKDFAYQARYHRQLALFFHEHFPEVLLPQRAAVLTNIHSAVEFYKLYLKQFLLTVEAYLYPFLKTPSYELLATYKPGTRGIVMGVGKKYISYAIQTLRTIRELHHCDYPVELFCIDRYEISTKEKEMIAMIAGNVEFRYINEYINSSYASIRSYAVKPFAVLLSSFEEVILMDADTISILPPQSVFQDPYYLKSQALYWYDRTLSKDLVNSNLPGNPFLRTIFPEIRAEIQNTTFYKGISYYLLEAGFVAIHKSRHFHALLLACKLNCKMERKVLWENTLGDKESFWFAHEMTLDYEYAFNPFPTGVIGDFKEATNDTLCGNILHFNHLKQPFWMNGGVVTNKWSDALPNNFTHWSMEVSFSPPVPQNEFWTINPDCYTSVSKEDIIPLTSKEIKLFESVLAIWRDVLRIYPPK